MRTIYCILIWVIPTVLFAQTEAFQVEQIQENQSVLSPQAFRHQTFVDQFSSINGWKTTISSNKQPQVNQLPPYKKPLPSMASSLLIPGSGQAIHGKWVRAGVYLAIDVLGIYQNRRHENRAQRLEREYLAKVNNNWSVVKYANWLVSYNEYYGTNLTKLDIFRDGASREPTFNNESDWGQINLASLRELERSTLYFTTLAGGGIQRDLAFSHTVPDFGSQQYYELAAKYWQFAPGWRDFDVQNTAEDISRLQWNFESMQTLSPLWFSGSLLADRFNNHYRYASNWVTVLILNHVVSAFDGLFTAKLAAHRLQISSTQNMSQLIRLKYDF